MSYTNQNLIQGRISAQNLVNLTDDNGTGSVDQGVLSLAISSVSAIIDGLLAPTYQTPFISPVPNMVQSAATVMACEALMTRRLTPEEKNPFGHEAEVWRDLLKKIAQNRAGLDNAQVAAFTPGAVQFGSPLLVNSSTA